MVPPQRCAKKANAKLATSKLVNTKSAKTILANATVANSYWGRAGVIIAFLNDLFTTLFLQKCVSEANYWPSTVQESRPYFIHIIRLSVFNENMESKYHSLRSVFFDTFCLRRSQRGTQRVHGGNRRPLRSSQELPSIIPEPPLSSQEAPKSSQETPRGAQETPNEPQRSTQGAPRSPRGTPRTPQEHPKSPKESPKSPQGVSWEPKWCSK